MTTHESGAYAAVAQSDAGRLPLGPSTVDLIVTSPPYFGLRDYGTVGQIGTEATRDGYLDALMACTAEWLRVLRPTGSVWVNLGDKYGKDKSLHGLPWRYALRCVDELGLLLRAEVIWSKPDVGLREKVTDRARRTHEQWFHLVRQTDYYGDTNALRVMPEKDYRDRPQYRRAVELFEAAGFGPEHLAAVKAVGVIDSGGGQVRSGGSWESENGRLAREVQAALRSYYRELCGSNTAPTGRTPTSVWDLPTSTFKAPPHLGVGHFAAFPPEFPERIITGWCPPGGVVLDPFGGSGTTAAAALALGRVGISVDLSHDYSRLARWRCDQAQARPVEKAVA